MRNRWSLCVWTLCLCSLLLLGGCKKSSSSADTPMQFIPRDNAGVVMINQMGALPQRVSLLLNSIEGKDGQFREFLKGATGRVGMDPLQAKSFDKSGLDPKGMMLGTRAKIAGRKAGLVVVAVKNQSRFEAWLKSNLQKNLLASTFTKDGKITTAYRSNSKKELLELVSYTFRGKWGLVAWDFTDSDQVKTTYSKSYLKAVLKQGPKASLQTDKAFHKALKASGKASQLMVYVPNRKEDPKEVKARAKRLQKELKKMRKKNPLLARLPASQLGLLLQNNPLKGGTASVSVDASGLKLQSRILVPSMVLGPIKGALPKEGSAAKLLEAVHRDAMIVGKIGIDPTLVAQLIPQIEAAIKQQQNKAAQLIKAAGGLNGALKKHVGLDLKKDVLSIATGHALSVLYGVDVSHIGKLINGNPFALASILKAAVVGQTKDPKSLKATLDRLAKSVKLNGQKIERAKGKKGTEHFSIMAWPNVKAYWLVYKSYFIYSNDLASVNRTIDAIDDAKQRLFANAADAGPLAKADHGTLHIDLTNLRSIVSTLPLMQRGIVAIAITSYNLDKLRSLTLSASPGDEHMVLKAALKLPKSQ